MKIEFHDKKIKKAEAGQLGMVMRATLIYGQPFTKWITNNLGRLYEQYLKEMKEE